MNTMTGKEVLRAIADGADPSEFEIYADVSRLWLPLASVHTLGFVLGPAQFRRKPRTRVVNGFTVPAPIQEMPGKDEVVYSVALDEKGFVDKWHWFETERTNLKLSRGLLFSTKEAAIANAKAMCGINPESEA